MMIFALTS